MSAEVRPPRVLPSHVLGRWRQIVAIMDVGDDGIGGHGFNLEDAEMTTVDKWLSGIAAASVVLALAYSVRLYATRDRDQRDYEHYLNDVHLQKQYASYFISAITVFFALSIRANFSLDRTAVVMLLTSFLLAAIVVSFMPVKVTKVCAGPGQMTTDADAKHLRALWVSKLVPLNLCMVITLLGLMDALQNTIFQGTPTGVG